MFYKGSNGYYGAWFLNGIAYTLHGTSKDGRLTGTWYFQTNGSPYFDSGIRTVDLEGKTRPAQTVYDMGAYEYYPPNQTPTDISLSGTSVAENLPSGTTVGTLSTTDPDAGNTFTYALVAGTGSTDNASFTISGSTLQTAAIFNYEAKNSYSIRVRSTDQGGLFTEEAFTITINNGNDPPLLSNLSKTLDQDTTLTFAASDFNAAFTDPDPGNSLQQIKITTLPGHGTLMLSIVAVTLNQEISTTQLDNLTYVPAGGYIGSDSFGWNGSDGSLYASSAASANLTVLAINHAPTDIALFGTSVAEGQPGGTSVGILSTIDPDVGDTFTYTLVAGTGGTDNASFTISGSTLQTAAPFNYQTKNSYSIRVRSTDQDGLFTEKAFTITVTKVGDINGDTKIDLIDFILVLQILSKQGGAGIGISGDINGDGKIGMEEAIYILQKLTGMR